MAVVRGRDRKQYHMFCLEDYIAADNPVRAIDAVVDNFDLQRLGFAVPKERGRSCYAASDMLKLYIYGYYYGIRSSRKLEAETKRNAEV